MNMNNQGYGAHEMLEAQELVRKLIADIEVHAVSSQMTGDRELKTILNRHIHGMEQTFQQTMNLLQTRGISMNHQSRRTTTSTGMQNHQITGHNNAMPMLSEMAMTTTILNSHKAGAMFGMQWANECVDPQLRHLLVTSANNCNMMAYEIWQYMNAKGLYQVPQFTNQMAATINNSLNQGMNQGMNQRFSQMV
jgi:spore coat protein CotF